MNKTMKLQGRELTAHDIDFILRLISDNPTWSRRKLSVALAQAWDWRNAKGDLKDMASRTLMLKLHDRGHIQLPARRQIPNNRMAQRQIQAVLHDTSAVKTSLHILQPLKLIRILPRSEHEELYTYLLATYHYLSYTSSVGENMKYLVLDNQDRPLACVLFGSSAWSAGDRDSHIGWDKPTRQRNLNYTTNNTRYLILPWVEVRNLASHILSLVARRLTQDWLDRYGHPIYCLETFVERDRFRGTCYQAANWQCVGQTQGRSRNDRDRQLSVPVKDIYLYPLRRDYRQKLSA
ncbi:MAG: hypothetical protein BMS9Abin33_1125 [Gammaproteobacteria bacterium]|nr:MAG: hypothetical protein BMS9Abin33_1125 [Gammaproteobacteria bacterium]